MPTTLSEPTSPPTAPPTPEAEAPATPPPATPQPTEVPPTPRRTEPPPTPTPPAPTATSVATPPAFAQYELVFETTWSAVTHSVDFPPNPHFSGVIGASHGSTAQIWREGDLATPGIKNMAETGEKSPLDGEIEALISDGAACAIISGGGIGVSPGVVSVTFTVTRDCPLVSIVSMIAPSPDWFVGVSGLSLFEDGAWVTSKVVQLHPYDAGTDSGTSYTSPNEPTSSPEAIYQIEAEPLLVDGQVPPLGTFTFTRLDV